MTPFFIKIASYAREALEAANPVGGATVVRHGIEHDRDWKKHRIASTAGGALEGAVITPIMFGGMPDAISAAWKHRAIPSSMPEHFLEGFSSGIKGELKSPRLAALGAAIGALGAYKEFNFGRRLKKVPGVSEAVRGG